MMRWSESAMVFAYERKELRLDTKERLPVVQTFPAKQ